jgi:hypothetical protein
MPGYGIIYLVLHYFFNTDAAIFNAIGIIQFSTSAVAAWCLGLTAMRLLNNKAAFYIVFLLSLFSPFNLIFNAYLLTESFSVSALVFGTFFLDKFMTSKKPIHGFASSAFYLWAMFLRPNIFVIAPVLVAYFSWVMYRKVLTAKLTALFFAPMIICFGAWSLHNLNQHGYPALLTHTTYYPRIEKSFVKEQMEFFNAYGYAQVSIAFVEKGEIYYYLNYPQKDVVIHIDNIDRFPVSEFNKDSIATLVVATNRIYFDTLLTRHDKDSLNSLVKTKLAAYRNAFINDYPMAYRFTNLIPILRDYVSVGATGYSGNNENFSIKKIVFSSMLFLNNALTSLIIFGGIAGCAMMVLTFLKQQHALQAYTAAMTIALFLSIPVVLRLGETRYIVPAYSFLIIGLAYLIFAVFNKTTIPFRIHQNQD